MSILLRKSKVKKATPLFPIGCPRSGTTLLAKVLNSHPAVLMTNETAVFLQLHSNITKSRAGCSEGLLYGKEYNALWADYLVGRAKDLIENYYERICEIEGKDRLVYWGEKHPHHYECFDFLTSLYPQARYIYIIRDPRDTACSISKLINVDYYEGLHNWKYAIDKCEAFIQSIDPQSLLRIRYEDFVADYREMARHIFNWLGLEYLPPIESFLREYRNVDAHTLWMPERSYIDFEVQSVGRWRREFSESERLFAEDIAGDFMRRYGYLL